MIYQLLKVFARVAFPLYIRKMVCNQPANFKLQGPVLLCCNHPNSFLDAILLCTLFDAPIYSLARGDVFKKKWAAKLLGAVKILPVYRTSEGVENLNENYRTFQACIEIFRQGGIVLIFSEGLCENEWHLRPLKKGTARLALSAWEQNIPLRILPVGINYSSFKAFGKSLHLFFGNVFTEAELGAATTDGQKIMAFNKRLRAELEALVYEIADGDVEKRKAVFEVENPLWAKVALAPFALLGYALHWPIYKAVEKFTLHRARESGHFDSILLGILFFVYPLYLSLMTGILFCTTKSYWALLLPFVLPLLGRCYLMVKKVVY